MACGCFFINDKPLLQLDLRLNLKIQNPGQIAGVFDIIELTIWD
jgi:hypothetical protein